MLSGGLADVREGDVALSTTREESFGGLEEAGTGSSGFVRYGRFRNDSIRHGTVTGATLRSDP